MSTLLETVEAYLVIGMTCQFNLLVGVDPNPTLSWLWSFAFSHGEYENGERPTRECADVQIKATHRPKKTHRSDGFNTKVFC